jgi:isopentenyl-diphosphate delta-isomerase
MSASEPGEQVVLVNDLGERVGVAPKATVHHARTPLHLAFSCYVFDAEGRLLLTQRAAHKPTWPGVWTNSFCGHPGPGEAMATAVRRRALEELRIGLGDLRVVLPQFRYRAVMTNGVRENELCPVFTAVALGRPEPDPAEVADARWVPWPTFRDDVLADRAEISPWCVAQVAELAAVETQPGSFAEAVGPLPVAALGGP